MVALTGTDLVKQAILEKAPSSQIFAGTDLSEMLKSKKDSVFRSKLGETMKIACADLVRIGLLVLVDSAPPDASPQATGKPTKRRRVSVDSQVTAFEGWTFTPRAEKMFNGTNKGMRSLLYRKCKASALEEDLAIERIRLKVALTCFSK